MMDKATLKQCFFKFVVSFVLVNAIEIHLHTAAATELGKFTTVAHGVEGTVTVIDKRTILVTEFKYDGKGPDAFFWVSNKEAEPDSGGQIVRNDIDGVDILMAYLEPTEVTLYLPRDKSWTDYKWLSVWCRQARAVFAQIRIPNNLEIPPEFFEPIDLGEFKRTGGTGHGLAGRVSILDSKTFQITNLYYDGFGPDAFFWVGSGAEINTETIRAGRRLANEHGDARTRLKAYNNETISIQLPDDLTMEEIEWLTIWCIIASESFGKVNIIADDTGLVPDSTTSIWKCVSLDANFQMEYHIDQTGSMYTRLTMETLKDRYVAFGVSGDNDKNEMVGADVAVVSWDKTKDMPHVEDYFINARSQCDQATGVGACPDELQDGYNDITLLGYKRNETTMQVTYLRLLETFDEKDKAINLDNNPEVHMVWAMGDVVKDGSNLPLTHREMRSGTKINLKQGTNTKCTKLIHVSEPPKQKKTVWSIDPIDTDTTDLHVEIGQSGPPEQGYKAITGVSAWGIVYYVNKRLSPQIHVERCKKYTFRLDVGDNLQTDHPFVITNSPVGALKEIRKNNISHFDTLHFYLGYDKDRNRVTGGGENYCEWNVKQEAIGKEFDTFDSFFANNYRKCRNNKPSKVLQWIPNSFTPTNLYYQCWVHHGFGWKIKVHDNKRFKLKERVLLGEIRSNDFKATLYRIGVRHLRFENIKRNNSNCNKFWLASSNDDSAEHLSAKALRFSSEIGNGQSFDYSFTGCDSTDNLDNWIVTLCQKQEGDTSLRVVSRLKAKANNNKQTNSAPSPTVEKRTMTLVVSLWISSILLLLDKLLVALFKTRCMGK